MYIAGKPNISQNRISLKESYSPSNTVSPKMLRSILGKQVRQKPKKQQGQQGQ